MWCGERPSAIYECGCTEVAEGECDCEGSQPVEFYDCDGVCVNDQDQDGVCDELEVMGCTSPTGSQLSVRGHR